MTLYTYGYGGRGRIQDLERYVAAGAVIVDVRLHARSGIPGWSGAALRRKLGSGYRHVPWLGNVNHREPGAPVKISDIGSGLNRIQRYVWSGTPLVFLCGCAGVEKCHRKVVADAAAERWGEVTIRHLKPGDEL